MTIQSPLAASAASYRLLRQELIDQHGLGDDDQVLLDSLDGATDVMDQLATMLRKARDLDRFAGMVSVQQKELAERKSALEDKAAKLRRIAVYFMDLIGRKRIEAPDFAYVLTKGRPTLVGDADPIELLAARRDSFVRTKYELNRSAIKTALECGEHVEGFSLSNSPPHLRAVT